MTAPPRHATPHHATPVVLQARLPNTDQQLVNLCDATKPVVLVQMAKVEFFYDCPAAVAEAHGHLKFAAVLRQAIGQAQKTLNLMRSRRKRLRMAWREDSKGTRAQGF